MEAAGKIYIGYPSRSDIFRIWHLTDLHYYNRACATSDLKRDIKAIAGDPYSFTFLGGDLAEFIAPGDPRWDPDCISPDVKVKDLGDFGHMMMEGVRNLLWPLKETNSLLAAVEGNHEKNFMRRNAQQGLYRWLCSELNVRYLAYAGFVDLVFVRMAKLDKPTILAKAPAQNATCGTQQFRCFVHHGAGSAITEGGKMNKAKSFTTMFDADLFFFGHVHDTIGKPIITIGVDAKCEKVIHREARYVISGSYLKTYEQGVTNYAEEKGYAPVPIGARYVTIQPSTRETRVVL